MTTTAVPLSGTDERSLLRHREPAGRGGVEPALSPELSPTATRRFWAGPLGFGWTAFPGNSSRTLRAVVSAVPVARSAARGLRSHRRRNQARDAHFRGQSSPDGVGLWRTTTSSLKTCTSSARSSASKCRSTSPLSLRAPTHTDGVRGRNWWWRV